MENNINTNEDYLLEVNDLKMYFDITTGFFKTTPLKAVDGVSFKIKRGETLGVVGESGCGKTTLGRTIMNLYKPSSGEILFDGVSISPYSDLGKIKKEKKFNANCIKFNNSKAIKELKKENLDADAPKTDEELKEIIAKMNEKMAADVEASNKEYDEKYQAKAKEIEEALAKIDAELAEKLAALKVEQPNPSVDKPVDEACAKAKSEAQSIIAHAKSVWQKEFAKAKSEFAVAKAEHNTKFVAKLQEVKALPKEEQAKAMKAYKIEKIVDKERVVNEFGVKKSVAYGQYQDAQNEVNEKLKNDIKAERAKSAYYTYLDTKKQYELDAKEAKYQIKSSSKIRMKKFRKECTMVFQDPYSSLNPRMTVADIIGEPLDINHLYKTKEERRSKILELMRQVGLSPEQSTRYAHEFSGGQRQRIGIARSLAVNPKFVVCDEPVSALDVSIQAQVINTFEDLQNELGLTYLFIAHDLLVVRHISDRIAVMYLGRVVELAETDELYDNPMHPYTISLLSAIPVPDPTQARENKRIVLEGDIPSPLNAPSGCPFRTRCSKACDKCKTTVPKLREVKPGHFVSCLLFDEEK